MVEETETNYRGTNFAVVTLLVLLVLVGGYFLVTGINNASDAPEMPTALENRADAVSPTTQ